VGPWVGERPMEVRREPKPQLSMLVAVIAALISCFALFRQPPVVSPGPDWRLDRLEECARFAAQQWTEVDLRRFIKGRVGRNLVEEDLSLILRSNAPNTVRELEGWQRTDCLMKAENGRVLSSYLVTVDIP